jgi:hypothetical protein
VPVKVNELFAAVEKLQLTGAAVKPAQAAESELKGPQTA